MNAHSVPHNALEIQLRDDEPRCFDLDLAKRLGFASPRMIRKLIKRHMASLDALGTRSTVERVIKGGDATEYYLNRKQAVFIMAKSETAEAIEATIDVVKRFDEYETGKRGVVDPMKLLNDPAALRGMLLTYSETVEALQVENEALGVRSMALERLEGAAGSMCISDAAKTLGVGRNELIIFLQSIRWIFKRAGNKNWLAYDAVRPRYMDHDDHPYQDSEGRDRVATRALVTAAGLVKLADLLVKHGLKKGGAA